MASLKRQPSRRQLEDARLAVVVRAGFKVHQGRYGSPRLHPELVDAGEKIGRHRVARLMREEGLVSRPKRRFVTTTDSEHGLTVAPNLLRRQFATAEANIVWVGDITYVPTGSGWAFSF